MHTFERNTITVSVTDFTGAYVLSTAWVSTAWAP